MSNHQFNDRRPTPQEEQAYTEARSCFAEHLKQFPVSQDAVKKLERNLAKTSLAMNIAASQPSSPVSVIQTDEGSWNKSTDLFDNIVACHRRTAAGVEYAVVEQFPNGTNEIWTQGRNAIEVLRAFAGEERHVLEIWTEDMTARVNEYLAENYPGQDMTRVAEGFMKRFTHAISQRETFRQKQGHGMRV